MPFIITLRNEEWTSLSLNFFKRGYMWRNIEIWCGGSKRWACSLMERNQLQVLNHLGHLFCKRTETVISSNELRTSNLLNLKVPRVSYLTIRLFVLVDQVHKFTATGKFHQFNFFILWYDYDKFTMKFKMRFLSIKMQ